MGALAVLREVEDFLTRDVVSEKLSSKSRSKIKSLLAKVTECIRNLIEQDKLDSFLSKQRDASKFAPPENCNSTAPVTETSYDDGDDNLYMDLTQVRPDAVPTPANEDGGTSGGSGSGYESYDSDEELPNRAKLAKEEDLSKYFTVPEYAVFSYVYLENKSMFKGKSWQKRIGVVKENHFLCYKKPNDASAVMNFPLRAYNCVFKNCKGQFVLVTFSTPNSSEAYKFHIDREKAVEWAGVLKDITQSFKDETSATIPPPVVARPTNTLPPPPKQPPPPLPAGRFAPIQRTQSSGVAAETTDADKAPGKEARSPPPVPPGHPTINQNQQSNHIGKGLKTAVTDIFKKDKTKKRMMTAENLGADISGYLSVFDNKWCKKWCSIRNNELLIYGKEERPDVQLPLKGCNLLPFTDPPPQKQFRFKILKDGQEVVFVEANSISEMGKWVEVLVSEMGLAPVPGEENTYMPVSEILGSIEPPKSRNDSSKSQPSEGDGAEDVYLDLNNVYQDAALVTKPPSSATPSRTGSANSTSSNEPRQRAGTLERDARKSDAAESKDKDKPKGAAKKGKQKAKKKDKDKKRLFTTSDITLPTEVTQMPEIQTVERTNVGSAKKTDSDPPEDERREIASREKRKKELKTEKADIKTKMLSLNVKKDELRKYIEAASSDKERGRLKRMLQKVTDEYSGLEKDDISLQLELRGLKDQSAQQRATADKRSSVRRDAKRELPKVNSGRTGNVLARAQMWEAGNKS